MTELQQSLVCYGRNPPSHSVRRPTGFARKRPRDSPQARSSDVLIVLLGAGRVQAQCQPETGRGAEDAPAAKHVRDDEGMEEDGSFNRLETAQHRGVHEISRCGAGILVGKATCCSARSWARDAADGVGQERATT